ncbi:Uncharacterized protein T11_7365, partial [Trichinella zimbabwensis]
LQAFVKISCPLTMEQKFLAVILFVLSSSLKIVFSKSELNQLCEPREYAKPVPSDNSKFLQCVNVIAHVGEWKEMKCPDNFVFQPSKQKCKSADAVRRQQSMCQIEPTNKACPQLTTCSTSNSNPVVGSSCHWPSAKLAPSPHSQTNFLQCIPTTSENQCGTWSQMSCPEGTMFHADLQICVTANLPNTCHHPQQGMIAHPVCPCMHGHACPGTSTCSLGICCQLLLVMTPSVSPPLPPVPPVPPQPQLPICPSGQLAVSFCTSDVQCDWAAGFVCIMGGCCREKLPRCPNGQEAVAACVGTGQSTCPPNYECQNGGCCPVQLPLCPTGIQAIQVCISDLNCPPGYGCINRGCCKQIICPSGFPASQFCQGSGQSTCPFGSVCLNGGCCPLPKCPNNQISIQICIDRGSCPPGFICHNGGCCPLPTCPGGQVCTGFCAAGGGCPPGYVCIQGGCCPLPICSSGQPAVSSCSLQTDCPKGFYCENGGCCPVPLPTCPGGQQAVSTCTGPGTCTAGYFCYVNTLGHQGCCPIPVCPTGELALQPCDPSTPCPAGYQCINSGCCRIPLPTCPDGQRAISSCTSNEACPMGYKCLNGGCCKIPLPICPNGQPAISHCGPGMVCPQGYSCISGGCCQAPQPVCPSGQPAVSFCIAGGQCPAGFICISGACCPAPTIVCPNGKQPIQQCGVGGYCPPGYFCISGYCCERPVVTPAPPPTICPVTMIPVCFCAIFNLVCPGSSVCNMGYCCSSSGSSIASQQRPGSSCQLSSQCSGYPLTSQCKQGRCICLPGARSNGVTCSNLEIPTNVEQLCDQFGTPCKKYYHSKTLRRKATPQEFGISNTTQPLWWKSLSNDCVTDQECTLDETCIRQKCYPLIRPGEHGCQLTEQCNRTVTGSSCVKSTSRNSKDNYCRCKSGLYRFEFSCVSRCPPGTIAAGEACIAKQVKQISPNDDLIKRITLVFYPTNNDSSQTSSPDDKPVKEKQESK